MKRIFRKIHLWLSVPFGIIISLICFSGAALVFESEIAELCHRDLYYVGKVEAAPLPMDVLLTKVAEALPDSVSVTGVSIDSRPERAYQVNLSKPRRASMYVDPYTGEIKGRYERSPFFYTMFKLHRWLLDSMKPDGGIFWGKIIVGVSTLVFVFVLLSGVIVWLPRSKKVLMNSLKIATHKGWRRFWYDLHIAGGAYALVLLLAMALTGLTWSFAWYRTGFYKVFGVEVQQGGGHGATVHKSGGRDVAVHQSRGHDASFTHWQQVYEELKEQNPHSKRITLSKGSATVAFDRYGNQRAADRYMFNPRSGEITEVVLYQDADTAGKIRGWIYSVHVGSWGGLFTRILTFIAALVGATLPLTGYYLWYRRLNRKSRNRPARESLNASRG